MMPKFSKESLERLASCEQLLQDLFNEVIKHFDCTIVDGIRDEKTQELYFNIGRSKLHFPKSKHNAIPPAKSKAVDAAPYIDGAIVWEEHQMLLFSGFVLGVAKEMGIKIRWGGDWDSDNNVNDENFSDLAHFELA